MNAVWFSRHNPTPAQLEEISSKGYALGEIAPEGARLGEVSIDSPEEAEAIASALLAECRAKGAVAVFGVFPTPILALSFDLLREAVGRGDFFPGTVTLFAAHNVQRSQEGGRPTFTHAGWKPVGILL